MIGIIVALNIWQVFGWAEVDNYAQGYMQQNGELITPVVQVRGQPGIAHSIDVQILFGFLNPMISPRNIPLGSSFIPPAGYCFQSLFPVPEPRGPGLGFGGAIIDTLPSFNLSCNL